MSLEHRARAVACAIVGHRFTVWVRAWTPESARHPHLGTWCRCTRCGHERDWLPATLGMDDTVLDRVHGVRRRLREVLDLARTGADELVRTRPR